MPLYFICSRKYVVYRENIIATILRKHNEEMSLTCFSFVPPKQAIIHYPRVVAAALVHCIMGVWAPAALG